MLVNGINHITFAVSDLEESIHFYTEVLDLELKKKWSKGAYLSAGMVWIALNLVSGDTQVIPREDDSHIAFNVDSADFNQLKERLISAGVAPYRENLSEGDSYYFCDPDGHKLEIHSNTMADRIKAMV